MVEGEVLTVFGDEGFFDFEHEEDGTADDDGDDVAEGDGDGAMTVRAEGVTFFWVTRKKFLVRIEILYQKN